MLQYSTPLDNRPNDRLTPMGLVSRPLFPGLPPPISTNITPSDPSKSPSTASSKLLRSPYISSRQTSSPVSLAGIKPQAASRPASVSSAIEDVFFPGDVIGEGSLLQNESIRLVPISSTTNPRLPEHEEPAKEFEVVRRLGAGSYAVVYLVSEVLYRPPPSDDGHITVGQMDLDDKFRRPSTVYGREYAIKCLSKANLDEEALAAQMSEVTIHQSLHSHPNIVTLHRTLETSSFLLLLLEYVPGEDLFYFLEQARDHYEADSPSSQESFSSRTPPTPSLLSNLHPSQLLSRTRLRLISSMFSQMCDAVAACHAQQVFHRDIKPENFIVTDGWITLPDGRQERKVIVKLTDFGLSTTDIESSDMDCGSAPYMSYECRNNVAPTYRPRAADVWSLGIVLINMLYHYNPWTDTAQWACGSFDLFQQQPVNFFMQRFTGMTRPVAELLANRVFNVLDDPSDDSKRITAVEFGTWAKDLPSLLVDQQSGPAPTHKRVVSVSSIHCHPLSTSIPPSHRPSSRQASNAIQPRSHSRAASLVAPFETPLVETSELSTVIDQELEEENDDQDDSENIPEGMTSRSTSTTKRRKRGARKGKGTTVTTPTTPKDETLATLAVASQSLAREISKASLASSRKSTKSAKSNSTTESARARRAAQPFEPVSMYGLPTAMLTGTGPVTIPPLPAAPKPANPPTSAPITPSAPVRKPSRWKLSFGKANAPSLVAGSVSPAAEEPATAAPIMVDAGTTTQTQSMSATASNVTTLLMGLNAPHSAPLTQSQATSTDVEDSSNWSRGRRGRESQSPGGTTALRAPSAGHIFSTSPHPSVERSERWGPSDQDRRSDRSPHSTRSGRPIASSASSVISGNWRSSMSTTSSAGTSTSAFTHYSNSSMRSVSTTATSVSSASWRSKGVPQPHGRQPHSPNTPGSYRPPGVPKNVKIMDGVPWELHQLPREQPWDLQQTTRDQSFNPVEAFGQPPIRKPRTRNAKPKDLKLDTINERPLASSRKTPDFPRRDASTSTTELDATVRGDDGEWQNKKVQKGQINALAKMLSALRR